VHFVAWAATPPDFRACPRKVTGVFIIWMFVIYYIGILTTNL